MLKRRHNITDFYWSLDPRLLPIHGIAHPDLPADSLMWWPPNSPFPLASGQYGISHPSGQYVTCDPGISSMPHPGWPNQELPWQEYIASGLRSAYCIPMWRHPILMAGKFRCPQSPCYEVHAANPHDIMLGSGTLVGYIDVRYDEMNASWIGYTNRSIGMVAAIAPYGHAYTPAGELCTVPGPSFHTAWPYGCYRYIVRTWPFLPYAILSSGWPRPRIWPQMYYRPYVVAVSVYEAWNDPPSYASGDIVALTDIQSPVSSGGKWITSPPTTAIWSITEMLTRCTDHCRIVTRSF